MYRDIEVDIVLNRLSVTWQCRSGQTHIIAIRGGLNSTQYGSNIIGITPLDMTMDRRLAEESWCRSWLVYILHGSN